MGTKLGVYQLVKKQKIPAPLESVWDFISTPKNLQRITPPYMGFEIISEDLPEKMYPGMIISYWVRPLLGIKMKWITEITHIREHEYFVDEQRVGPYAMWHHQHLLNPVNGGVVMTDIVTYRPPLGLLGRVANRLVIHKRLEEIFDYREEVLNRVFKATPAK